MSEFIFPCPKCRKDVQCDESYAGVQINCPICQASIVVPHPAAAAPPPAPMRPSAMMPSTGRTAYQPPTGGKSAGKSSGGLRKALVIVGILVVCAALGAGGWYFYKKHQEKVEAATGSPAAQVATPSGAAAVSAMNVLVKVHEAYAGLTSLRARGTSTMIIDMSGLTPADLNPNAKKTANRQRSNMPQSITNLADVSIKLTRSGLYRVEGITKMAAGRMMMTNTLAAWSAGTTNYSLMLMNNGSFKNYTTMKDRKQALTMNGQLGGLVMVIPGLFFDESADMAKLISEWGQTDDETLNGQDCYTLTGKMIGQKLKIWVSKADYMILQSQMTLGGAVSDADLDTAINTFNANTNMPAAQMAQMKVQMKQSAAMITKIKGTITETYDDVEQNGNYPASDFNYPVPRGVRLTASPF